MNKVPCSANALEHCNPRYEESRAFLSLRGPIALRNRSHIRGIPDEVFAVHSTTPRGQISIRLDDERGILKSILEKVYVVRNPIAVPHDLPKVRCYVDGKLTDAFVAPEIIQPTFTIAASAWRLASL